MKKIIRLTWSRGLLKNEKYFKSFSNENIDIDFICYLDLYYDNWFKNIKNNELLSDYDIYWLWWNKWLSMLQWFIYKKWILEKRKIIDEQKLNHLSNDKFSQILFCEHYWFKIPKSLFFIIDEIYFDKYIKIIEEKIKYPFISKIPNINKWNWVFLIKNRNDLLENLNKNIWWWLLFQEKIENTWDYRVITIWEKVIWAIKRYNPNDYRNNIWKWWTAEKVEISDFMKNLSIDITKKFNLSISGIDYFITENNDYYVIEINELPQYAWFDEVTWISYWKEVMNYFKNLYN